MSEPKNEQLSQAEQQFESLPKYSKSDILQIIGEADSIGADKFVSRVVIKDKDGNQRTAILKIMRSYTLRASNDSGYKDKLEREHIIKDEVIFNFLLKNMIPDHIPEILGRYEDGESVGFIVEEIVGNDIIATSENDGVTDYYVKVRPTLEQAEELRNAIEQIISAHIPLSVDAVSVANIRMGVTSKDNRERLFLIDASSNNYGKLIDSQIQSIRREFNDVIKISQSSTYNPLD